MNDLPASDRWFAVVLEAPVDVEERLAARLGAGSLGVQSRPMGPGRVELRIFTETHEAARELAARTGRKLRIEGVEDERWVERWVEGLRPFRLGSRFVVVPGEGLSPDSGRLPLRLIPGRAFGTGEHPTTRMCAAELEQRVEASSRWLDLGCGSAILAMIAARCGARAVLGVDIDAEALGVAARVLSANGLGEEIELTQDASGWTKQRFDGVVCNISAGFVCEHAASLAGCLGGRGILVVTGFLPDQSAEVRGALTARGFNCVREASCEGWTVQVYG